MSLIVHLLLSLSLHACSARPLRINTFEGTGGSLQLAGKETRPTIDEYLRVKEKMSARIGKGTTLASCCTGENTMQQKISEELGGRNEKNNGNNVALSSAEVMHDTVKVEDERRQARTLESLPSDNAEESVGAKENDMGEDIAVMDYAQPHRKPPIHNKEP